MKRQMKLFILLAAMLSATSLLSRADSLQLKNGHHYYGRYAGGTEGVIAFETEGSVQYFAVSSVALVLFGESGEQAISPLGKKLPSPPPATFSLQAKSKGRTAKLLRVRRTRQLY